jgi:hypothetical protein
MLPDAIQYYERNEDFMALKIHIVVSCVMTSCCVVGGYHVWGEHIASIFYPEDVGSMILRNTGIHPPGYQNATI